MQVSDNINVWHTLYRRRCWTSMEVNNFYMLKIIINLATMFSNIKCLPYIYVSQIISPYFKILQFNSVVSLCATQCAVYLCLAIVSRSRKISWPTNGPYCSVVVTRHNPRLAKFFFSQTSIYKRVVNNIVTHAAGFSRKRLHIVGFCHQFWGSWCRISSYRLLMWEVRWTKMW